MSDSVVVGETLPATFRGKFKPIEVIRVTDNRVYWRTLDLTLTGDMLVSRWVRLRQAAKELS